MPKIGVSREWCNKLLASLKAAGWLQYSSGRRERDLRTTCTFAIGNTLKQLLITLTKSHAKKAKQKPVVKSGSQVFPLFQDLRSGRLASCNARVAQFSLQVDAKQTGAEFIHRLSQFLGLHF
jgi:hypothetical protein